MNWYVLFVQTLYEDSLCDFLNRNNEVLRLVQRWNTTEKIENQMN